MSLTYRCPRPCCSAVAGSALMALMLLLASACSDSDQAHDVGGLDQSVADGADATGGEVVADVVDAPDMAADLSTVEVAGPDQTPEDLADADSKPAEDVILDLAEVDLDTTADQELDMGDTDGGDTTDGDATDGDAAAPKQGAWSVCIHVTEYASSWTCSDYCQERSEVCDPSCGPAGDSNWYSAYFFDTEASCQANTSVIAATGCQSSFGMEAASNHTWARCCCAGE